MALPDVRVATAREASELDTRTIAAGVPSRALMQRAGAAAAGEIWKLLDDLAKRVVVYVGSGNNGGDGWVVARSLASAGVGVDVVIVGDTRTDDARAERALAEAEPLVRVIPFDDHERGATPSGSLLIVDALLGTGTKGAPRAPAAGAIAQIARARDEGATVVSIDIPSGVDADTGATANAVRADVTLTFGTLKRGLLVAREAAGRIVLLEIGLRRADAGSSAERSSAERSPENRSAEEPSAAERSGAKLSADGAAPAAQVAIKLPMLADGRWVRSVVPPFAADAHKGTRKKLVIVGGRLGMAGAPVLAARAAMRSGIGMVRLVVAAESLPVVQGSEPHALARAWPADDAAGWEDVVGGWADVVLVGPGLGASGKTRELVEALLGAWRGPVVLDADALNVFAGEAERLGRLLDGRPALLTPHAMEFARLSGRDISEVLDHRFDVGADLARTTGAAVLLKGVPTVISAPDGATLVSAAGTPALAAAGSGDLLGGIAATLLAQLGDPQCAGAAAAWVHGRAAEIAEHGARGGGKSRRRYGAHGRTPAHHARGTTLADIEAAVAQVWREDYISPSYPVLAELPSVGGG